MKLSEKFRWQFNMAARITGERLYEDDLVTNVEGDESFVEADVLGRMLCFVSLELLDNKLKVTCTCQTFKSGQLCEHIWATVLESDFQDFLSAASHSFSLKIVKGDPNAASDNWELMDGEKELVSIQRRKQCTRAMTWKQVMKNIRSQAIKYKKYSSFTKESTLQVLYVLEVNSTLKHDKITLRLLSRQKKKDGEWGVPRNFVLRQDSLDDFPDPKDQFILASLKGSNSGFGGYYSYMNSGGSLHRLSSAIANVLFPKIYSTGRGFLRQTEDDVLIPVEWKEGPAWKFYIEVKHDTKKEQYLVQGFLRKGEIRRELSSAILVFFGGWVFWPGSLERLDPCGAFPLLSLLKRQNVVTVPIDKGNEFIGGLLECNAVPTISLPEELRYEERHVSPKPRLTVKRKKKFYQSDRYLIAKLSFDYEGVIVDNINGGVLNRGFYKAGKRCFILRDKEAEMASAEKLNQLGFREATYRGNGNFQLELLIRRLPKVVDQLVHENWHVEADGKLYRSAGSFSLSVSSGIDWFELHGECKFGDTTAKLPEILSALKRKANTVVLDDGSIGMLPEQWLKKYCMIAGMGKVNKDHVRFKNCQAGVLDALLAAQDEVTCDSVFKRVRKELRTFESVKPVDPDPGFKGKLRDYQRDGLGWLFFLQRFGFGGCLADDMGLGKTVQVLALLESRRLLRRARSSKKKARPAPSLVVMPRSLIFNWKQEALRFTPKLRVLENIGSDRIKEITAFNDYDVILTTYGSLRRDIIHLKDMEFDYIILDEAQAIKNAKTASAKASRLLNGNYRLALSGTPIENHIGELWSIFEFLNPGMLGSASVFRLIEKDSGEEANALLARSLRPFILRRTKGQVARDLPDKFEETLYCEFKPAQQKLYDELRDHYRQTLLSQVQTQGIKKLKFHVLEALLRLRQAACHPGLIDKVKSNSPSAKLEALVPQVKEVIEEGHKALLFSQFTSMLSIVKKSFDKAGISYEYLDGKTRDRQARVEHFQNDPECMLFLISLKAGGLGLNLTAAEYVFLLDPWWNPAVESQAIDRVHRIGQTRKVFAYRLIVRNTVEEKVIELQQTKRALADSIINGNNSLIRSLKAEDLELLLS